MESAAVLNSRDNTCNRSILLLINLGLEAGSIPNLGLEAGSTPNLGLEAGSTPNLGLEAGSTPTWGWRRGQLLPGAGGGVNSYLGLEAGSTSGCILCLRSLFLSRKWWAGE